jgi:hypothetical protein
VEKAIPNAGEHVIGGSIVSKDVESVYQAIDEFMSLKLHLQKTQGFVATKAPSL